MEEYLQFFAEDMSEQMLEKHGIELVLYKKHQYIKFNWFEKYFLYLDENKFNIKQNQLEEYLDNSASWQLSYEDKISAVYVKAN